MNEPSYKYCSVLLCKNNTLKNLDKLFIHVPKSKILRKKWLNLARRDPNMTSDKSTLYFCEDHFNLPEDMENYIQYRVMGSVMKVRLKPNCLPSKFSWQPDSLKRTAQSATKSVAVTRQCSSLIEEAAVTSDDTAIATTSAVNNIQTTSLCSMAVQTHQLEVKFENQSTQVDPDTENKLVQVSLISKYRSKAIQKTVETRHKATSPIATYPKCIGTSPFKISTVNPSLSGQTKVGCRRKLISTAKVSEDSSPSVRSTEMKMSSDVSFTSSPSIQSLQLTSDSEQENNLKKIVLEHTIRLFQTNPRYYIGIPKECYFLVNLIQAHTKIPEEHILLCLSKIRLNTPFFQLGDQFGISLSYASKIFTKNIPVIVNVLYPFIIKPDKTTIKLNLPTAFRHKYHNIHCIIDCLEIEIQKPSKSIHQALTWSEYKKANTIKYLVSCTPDGIVNYISPGFGGRISDVSLVESCKFLDDLPPGVSILADRGFKHIEQLLQRKGFQLVRPPSVPANSKLSKLEARKTKEIASLRIHIERVIRRIREFSMLKPNSVVNTGILKYLDECIKIACALINVQDSLIKNK